MARNALGLLKGVSIMKQADKTGKSGNSKNPTTDATANSKKGRKPIAPDKKVETQFAHEQAARNFMPARKELNNNPHRQSKAEKGTRKK